MKNKLFKSLSLTVLLLTLLVSNVFAFSFATTDGVWKEIDSTTSNATGADCATYGRVVSESFTPIDTLGIINNVNVGPGGENEKYVRNPGVCQGDPDGDYAFKNNTVTGWARSTNYNWNSLGSHDAGSCSNASDLFISEYIFQTNSQMGIEIYNGTNVAVNLSDYSLLLFSSDREHVEFNLSGTLAKGDVHVVVSSTAVGNTSHEDEWFSNNSSYRTVVLVKNYAEAKNMVYGDQRTLPGIYTNTDLDENQVRYGDPNPGSCPAVDNQTGYGTDNTNFQRQSGFGFDGQINDGFEPEVNELFPVGRFCHYNNPVAGNRQNDLDTVPLTVTINGLNCPTDQAIDPPFPNNNLSFEFLVTLDETPNANNPCEYGPYVPASGSGWNYTPAVPASPGWPTGTAAGSRSPNQTGDVGANRSGCADMVAFTAPAGNLPFTCVIDPDPETYLEQKYYVSLMGFTATPVGGTCPNVPVGDVAFNQVYTAEQSNNCYCMYAAYTRNQVTPVTLASFGANWTESGVLIDWETVTETNNFGFNIMRAESVDGERIQINPEMIFSSLAPGDPFGSSYEYLDETAVPGTEYFYWLVDVPLDSSEPGIYGPISPAE